MAALNDKIHQASEESIAHLTNTAYQAILERGFRGSFLELELSLWNAVRHAVKPSAWEPESRIRRPVPLELV